MVARNKLITGVATGPVIYPARPRKDWWESSATQLHELGARYTTEDGRGFRYAKADDTALVTGDLIQSATLGGSDTTVQTGISVQADSSIGDTSLSVTLTVDAASLNQFAGGYLAIADDAGEGQLFRIVGNAVATAGGTCVVYLDRPILVAALVATSLVQMMTDPYYKVIQAVTTTPSGLILGIATHEVPANYYCWLQTWGMACCSVKTAGLMGNCVIYDVAAAGSVGVTDGNLVNTVVGQCGIVTATTVSGLIFLTIAP